ncbi:MAG: chitobiase/beta-hexosaminidase C-terminal domain-containing protein [Treponema sp.]|nr:chitobiase/beta-hexosaminidase C-terminal domain-containing protein [Treponema sp.]
MKNKAKLVGIIALAAVIGFVLISCENPLNEEPKTVATPKANPAAGTYSSARNVTLSCATSGASIYYTTNGSTPTTSSTRYTKAISISKNTTLKAIAVKSGMSNSDILIAAYIINIPLPPETVETPTANPPEGTYTSAQSVTLSCATSGADIYYTLDDSTPNSSSTLYSGAIDISGTATLKAIAIKNGMNDSYILTALYTIDITQLETVATPTANPAAGTFTSAQSVTLSCATSEAAIYYTLDDTTPNSSSTLYSSAIDISETTTLKAIAVKSGMNDSDILTAAYTIDGSPVTFSALTANGSASQTTTQLTITLSAAITSLSANDITLNGVAGVSKGTLSGSGPSYTLPISGFTAGGTLSVAVAKTGYVVSGSPKTVTIFYYSGVVVKPTDIRILDPATQSTQLLNPSFTLVEKPHGGGNKSLPGSPYGYETWDEDTSGDANFRWYGANQGGGAAFRAEWGTPNRPKDFLARVGYFWNQGNSHTFYGNIYCGFNFTKSGQYRGNFSYIGIYGWSKNPTVEYYIVENSYGNAWNDHAGYIARLNQDTIQGDDMGSYNLDGSDYKVYKKARTGPSIEGNNTSFTQFFSVRQNARTSGTISVTKHFKQWEEKGMNLGSNMYECKFKVEVGGTPSQNGGSTTGWFDASFIQFYRAKDDGTIIQITP